MANRAGYLRHARKGTTSNAAQSRQCGTLIRVSSAAAIVIGVHLASHVAFVSIGLPFAIAGDGRPFKKLLGTTVNAASAAVSSTSSCSC